MENLLLTDIAKFTALDAKRVIVSKDGEFVALNFNGVTS